GSLHVCEKKNVWALTLSTLLHEREALRIGRSRRARKTTVMKTLHTFPLPRSDTAIDGRRRKEKNISAELV
ncbi:MAG: hypothetical protein NWE76_08610, partial [Candidatus Bathyarchaeota archaeon]|nr:hypothetical protein [Candidatus Bathyarchaeota archaeon]